MAATRLTAREIRAAREQRDQVKVEEPTKPEAIIEAARHLFTTIGYEATTMAEVARQAGVGVGTVYLYFKNKSDLLNAVRGDWERQYLEYMGLPEIQAIPHERRARPLVEKSFAICAQNQEMVQLMGMQPEQLGDWFAHDHGLLARAIEAMLEEGIAAGVFRPMDTKYASVVAYGMVNQCLIQCFMFEDGHGQEAYKETLVDALEQWILRPEVLARLRADEGRE